MFPVGFLWIPCERAPRYIMEPIQALTWWWPHVPIFSLFSPSDFFIIESHRVFNWNIIDHLLNNLLLHMRKYKARSMPKAIKKRIKVRDGSQLSRRNPEDRSDNCHRENNLKIRLQESKSMVIWEIIFRRGKGLHARAAAWAWNLGVRTGLGVNPTAWPL